MDGREIEKTMITQEKQGFLDRFRSSEDNSYTFCVLVLPMTIDVTVVVLL
jgi:hypothetical protein